MATIKTKRRLRITRGIRKKISGTVAKPRLSVFRSNSGIYAQIIDDSTGKTLAASSTLQLKGAKGTKVELSKQVGQAVAETAKAAGVTEVVFDRGGFLYHGRIKALAEGAREGGLKF